MQSLEQFTFAAIYVFLPSVPVTHSLGLVAHCPSSARARHIILYPLKGGRHHFIFQVIAWVVWATSILIAAPIALHKQWLNIPTAHVEVLAGAAAIGSVFAELFMIKSLLVFDPKVPVEDSSEPTSPRYRSSRLPKPLASTAVVAMGLLWATMGGGLLLATEFLASSTTKHLYFVVSAVCILIGATTTHGLGGQLRYASAKDVGTEISQRWRFFQPFQGGVVFAATQALGWALFSSSLISIIYLIFSLARGMAYCIRCWIFATGSAMLISQLFLGVSIWMFKNDIRSGIKAVQQPKATAAAAAKRTSIWIPILMMYLPVHIFFTALFATFAVVPAAYASAIWIGGCLIYYLSTIFGEPEHTGKREWPAFKDWFARNLQPALNAWMGSVEVVYDGIVPLDPCKKYVFGYAPHGLFPIGGPYLPLLPGFRKLFPGIHPTPLVASVLFFTPIIRDFVSWCGVRQVSKRTFIRALRETNSVILVPGGQAELIHTGRLFSNKEFVIYPKHKGFVRLAAQQGASLVPVLAFGELDTLRNFVDLPTVQAWTYKKLGFPVPYLVVGRWGVTPFPSKTPLKFVVGTPIDPPEVALDGEERQEQVALMHKQFYDSIERLYHKYQPSFPSYKDVRLVMMYS
ncbi:g9331 [Coccomyxa elongata]